MFGRFHKNEPADEPVAEDRGTATAVHEEPDRLMVAGPRRSVCLRHPARGPIAERDEPVQLKVRVGNRSRYQRECGDNECNEGALHAQRASLILRSRYPGYTGSAPRVAPPTSRDDS